MSYIMKMNFAWVMMFLFVSLGQLQAQTQPIEPDKSPMDMSYYPFGYPIMKVQNPNYKQPVQARVIYSRPQKNGRTVFGGIVPYGEVWRLGANENTEIEFFRNVHIGNKRLEKGRYSLFAIPQQGKWTLIFSKDLDSWGSFNYNQKNDVIRTDVNTSAVDNPFEYFTIVFDGNGALVIAWENTKAVLPIRYSN